jgi:KEOPS complex subunit Pcc1
MNAEFVLECEDQDIIYNSLRVEGIKAKIYLESTRLILKLEAEDITEMRAAINGWLRLIKMCEKIIEVLK